jgi:hypothetical protein
VQERPARPVQGQDKRIKPGVLIVMALIAGTRKFFSLIKYDHEQVLAYDVADTRAILREIANSFTNAPDSHTAWITVQVRRGD